MSARTNETACPFTAKELDLFFGTLPSVADGFQLRTWRGGPLAGRPKLPPPPRTMGFDHRTLEAIRLMAVERVRSGERSSSVVASYGFNRTTIYRWLDAAAKPGVGLRALYSRPATGRPRSLTPSQERQVFRWINGRDPRQYGLDFGLWTRSVVADLIARKFNIRLGVTAVGELLAKLGLTPQKPLQRAYQRDPEAIEAWRRARFPAIAEQAKASGGEVYFWDESGFRAAAVHGKTWGKRGQTGWLLVLHLPGRAECRGVCLAAAPNDAASFEAGAFGARRTSRAQDHVGESIRCLHEGHADTTFSSWLCA
jgi:transposase